MTNPMQQMMQKMMFGMMKPEYTPGMMQKMMDNMFREMTTDDRIAFMQDMMPRCMTMIFSELEPRARSSLASAMLERMADVLREQKTGTAVQL